MSKGPPVAMRRLYRATVAALPPVTRTVFLLHRAEGLSVAEITVRLDLTHAAVTEHVAEALVTLDRALRDAGY